MWKDELKEKLEECGAIKFGDFILASGKKSSYYVDIKKAATKVEVLKLMAKYLSKEVKGDIIGGVELGAVPLTVAVALELGKDYLIIRKESKEHGTRKMVEGEFKKGTTVDIIEDVITTGGSVLRAVRILRDLGLNVERVICVVDREEGGHENLKNEGVKLISLLRASDLNLN